MWPLLLLHSDTRVYALALPAPGDPGHRKIPSLPLLQYPSVLLPLPLYANHVQCTLSRTKRYIHLALPHQMPADNIFPDALLTP